MKSDVKSHTTGCDKENTCSTILTNTPQVPIIAGVG